MKMPGFLFRLYLGFGSMQYKAGNRQEVCFDKCFVVFLSVRETTDCHPQWLASRSA